MSESGRWLTTEERDDRVIVSAQINPRDLADDDLPAVAKEITTEMSQLPAGRPVVLAGDWPLWAIARAARLAHPRAVWIGVQERDSTVIVVAAGQEAGRLVQLASIREGAYTGDGPCDLIFRQTTTRGVYRLDVVHPTPGRPIDGRTTVDLNSVRTAIERLQPPSDLIGVLITGNTWRVVMAMLANSPALRPAQWCAVDEPRRNYAVTAWGTHTGEPREAPGALVPREDLIKPVVIRRGPLLNQLRKRWTALSINVRVAILVPLAATLIGLCGTIYATTLPILIDRQRPTPTATATPSVTPALPTTVSPP